MRSSRAFALATAMAAAVLVGCSGGDAEQQEDVTPTASGSETTSYLSLGDSAAAGFQPIGGQGSEANGYADQLSGLVRSSFTDLRLVKFGCAGETAESLVTGVHSPCSPPSVSQLDQAANFLEQNSGKVAFITLNIGGVDLVDACLDDDTVLHLDCVRETMPDVQKNLARTIQTLQTAAPDVPIAGMSYWNPFLGVWISGPDGPTLARTDEKAFEVFNAGLVATYQDEGALVADVAGPDSFNIADFTDTVETKKWGEIPGNVANACTWTWICTGKQDIHPNTEGYGVIAKAFEAVLSSSIP